MLDIYEKIYSLSEKNNNLINATIELLTKCNWQCKHCYIPTHNNKGFSKKTLFKLFKELRNIGCFDLSLTGGEIFYRNDTMDIIRKAREMFFNITLLTNISLLDEKKIKELSQLYISLITCTIFSLNENIHDSITGVPGSLKKSLNNIMLIKKYNIPLEIKTVIMYDNYTSYKELKQFCQNNEIQYKVDADVFSKSDGNSLTHKLRITKEQMQEILLDIDELKKFKPHKHCSNEPICPVVKNHCSIDSNGFVYPCNKYFVKLGNIYNAFYLV